ncbi:MAG TPA: GxxExxY protein, partial [Gemmatimonadaceae bacterium]|nr:GxxExxY protein [Gemmatimonadaceae bacterium]
MARLTLIHERLSYSVIGAFFEVYYTLGFGFLEHVYVASLTHELHNRGHDIGREVSVPVLYKGEEVARQRLDMIVDGKLIVETKSTRTLHDGAVRQVENYLRATSLELGLLLHFGPQPKFYRVIATNPATRNTNPPFPRDPQFSRGPRNPSVSVASGNNDPSVCLAGGNEPPAQRC